MKLQKAATPTAPKTVTITADMVTPSRLGTKTTLSQNVTISKNLITSGTLNVAGATNLDGGLTMDTNKFVVANGTGNTTIGGTLNVAGATSLDGGLTMDTNKFVVANGTGNTTIGGTLNVTDATTLNTLVTTGNASFTEKLDLTAKAPATNWHDIKGNKTIDSIGTSDTEALTLVFADLTGRSEPLKRGAIVKLHVLVSGTILSRAALYIKSINYYEATLIISPGAILGDNCTRTIITESSTGVVGLATTITSGVSGTGTTAIVTLTSSISMSAQSVDVFYEVLSSNLVNVS